MCAARSVSRCTRHRRPPIPRQPILTVRAALELIAMYVSPCRRNETIIAVLGSDYVPFGITTVTNTAAPDVVIDIVERVVAPQVHGRRAEAIVAASLYTGDSYADPNRMVDRWCEMSDIAEHCGVELLEWFVITDTIVCPRDLVGEPPRWPAS